MKFHQSDPCFISPFLPGYKYFIFMDDDCEVKSVFNKDTYWARRIPSNPFKLASIA